MTLAILAMAALLLCARAEGVGAQSLGYRIEGDTLAVIDPLAREVVDRIPLLGGARNVEISPDGGWAYVQGWGSLQFVDLQARLLRRVEPVGNGDDGAPRLRLAPDGQRLYFYEDNVHGDDLAIEAWDAAGRFEMRWLLPVPPGSWSSYVLAFDVDAAGERGWAVLSADVEAGHELWIYELDLKVGVLRGRLRVDATGASGFGAATIAAARGALYVSVLGAVLEIDLPSGAVRTRIPLAASVVPVWDDTRQRLYAWSYVSRDERERTSLYALDPQRGRARELAAFEGWPQAVALTPDGETFWVGFSEPASRTVIVDAETGTVTGAIAADGDIRAQAFAPAPQGAPPAPPRPAPTPAPAQAYRAVVLSGGAATLSEIDTGAPAVVGVRRHDALLDVRFIGASAEARLLYGVSDDVLLRIDSESGEALELPAIDPERGCCLRRGAVAADGSLAWVGEWSGVWAIDPSTGARIGPGEIHFDGYDVDALAFAPDGERLFVAIDTEINDYDWGTLHVIDPVNGHLLHAVRFVGRAADLTISADGRRAWIAASDAVVVVDLVALAVIAVIPAPAEAIALSRDGAWAYTAGWTTGSGRALSLTAIDTSALRVTGSVAVDLRVGDAARVADLALTPDGQRALLAVDGTPARLAVIDLARLAVVGALPVGAGPSGVVIAADPWTPPAAPTPRPRRPAENLRPCMLAPLPSGRQPPHGAILLIDPQRHGVATTIQIGEPSPDANGEELYDGVSAVAADADGTLLYATVQPHRGGAGYLAAVDPATRSVVGRVVVGPNPWSVMLTADGRYALVANQSGSYWAVRSSLSIVDLHRWRLHDEIALPEGAVGVYPSADGGLLFVRTRLRREVDQRAFYDEALVAIDPLSGAKAFEISLSSSRTPAGGIGVLPDGRTLLADIGVERDNGEPESVVVLDLDTLAPSESIQIPFTNWGYRSWGSAAFAVSPDGSEVYRTSGASPGTVVVLDPVGRTLLAQIPVDVGLGAAAYTPDGAFVYASGGLDGLAVIDTATRRLSTTIPLGGSSMPVAAMIDAPCDAPLRPPATPTPVATATPDGTHSDHSPTPTLTPPPTWSGAWVELRIGSASGARGATVPIDVRLDGAAVAGTQIGIAYAAPLAIAATERGLPACRVHADTDKLSVFAFWPSGCSGAHCRMVRALTLAFDNVDPIADGARLFTCDVTVAADAAPGAYPLRAVEVGASDAQGNAMPARGHAGEVRVPAAQTGRGAQRAAVDAGGSGCTVAMPARDASAWPIALPLLLIPTRRRGLLSRPS